jgi:ankyrin repeat protein
MIPEGTGDWFEKEQLHFAVQDGDVVRVKQLLAEGAAVNAWDEDGYTPLHYAAMKGHLEIMQILIAAGADVNAHRDDEEHIDNTPLREVAGNCSVEVAKLLVDAGADPTIPGWMQLTALHQASERKGPEGVKVHQLLEQAARKFGKL